MKKLILLLIFAAGCSSTPNVQAPKVAPVREERTNFTLTTGNGFGFALFDAQSYRLQVMLDHPYRSLRAPKDRKENGPERRNLLQEFSFPKIDAGQPVEASYVEQTNVIRGVSTLEGQRSERYFFEPFGLEANALVALVKSDTLDREIDTRLKFNLGASITNNRFWESPLNVSPLPGEKIVKHGSVWLETGAGRGTMIYIPLTKSKGRCEPACIADDATLILSSSRENSWSGVMVAYVEDPKQVEAKTRMLLKWIGTRKPETLLNDSLQEWRAWRVAPVVALKNEDETKLWRQSEAVLRMSQVLEPGRGYGMLLASLAPGQWTIGWVRDGSYATVALARIGHFAEAKKSLDFFLNAEPVGLFKNYVGGVDYRISVTRYYGNGEEEADYSEQPTPNVELDGWGLVLWAARQYVEASGDRAWLSSKTRKGKVYEVLRDEVAGALAKQVEANPRVVKPDSSIWEVHQTNARHYLFTSIMAERGLCDFAWLAHTENKSEDAQRFGALAKELRHDIPVAFLAPEGHLLGAIERSAATDSDAAVVELFTMDTLDDATVANKTFKHLDKVALPTGGYKRSAGPTDYEMNEWIFVDYRMASAFYKRGEHERGDAVVDRLTNRVRENFYLLPEQFVSTSPGRKVGSFMGSSPMTGYGSGVQMLAFFDRAGKYESHSCSN